MSLVNAQSGMFFKDVPEGRAFYPFGILTRGCLVNSAIERRLKIFLNLWWLLGYGYIILVLNIHASCAIDAIISILLLLLYAIPVKLMTKGCGQVSTRLTQTDFIQKQARSYSNFSIYGGMVLFAAMTVTTAATVISSLHDPNAPRLIAGVLFFVSAYVAGPHWVIQLLC